MKHLLAIAAAAAALVALGAMGCGVKSAPVPPEHARPERILDLRAQSVRGGVRLSWSRPRRYAGGDTMRDLAGFTILRADGVGGYRKLVEIPVTDQERFQLRREFGFTDRNTLVGGEYRYVVISRTTDGYESLPSNEAALRRTEPPPAPSPETFTLPTPSPLR